MMDQPFFGHHIVEAWAGCETKMNGQDLKCNKYRNSSPQLSDKNLVKK